ncbi:MAG: segregation/condensation protein A [Lachnospiraceae bacterium]|nr:segregation/condensation protein A [Lachnospiraceae bacterium]
MQLEFDLNVFRGPLDLLMHLIEKNKIDIYDIPIGLLTDQYMACLENMEPDLDSNSEFLVMASTLLYLKARSLLPRDEEEEEEGGDPRDELVRRLLEYRMFQEISQVLEEQEESTGDSAYRKEQLPEEVRAYKEPVNLDELLEGVDMKRLHRVFQMLMRRQEQMRDPVRSNFGKIRREPLKVGDRIAVLTKRLKEQKHCWFSEVLEEGSRFEVVVTFLAVLELMKAGQVVITQEERFGDIYLEAAGGMSGLSDEALSEITEY